MLFLIPSVSAQACPGGNCSLNVTINDDYIVSSSNETWVGFIPPGGFALVENAFTMR